MEIVSTHNNMDFDALAAEFAVTKLHPAARMLLGHPLVGNIRDFLALYRDALPLAQAKFLDLDRVQHIYIVDCQHLERLDHSVQALLNGSRKQPVTYTIFDHHQLDREALGPNARRDSIIQTAGSCTTLLVNELRKRGVKLMPFEATLLVLGIYEDSGCLTYGGTSAADAEAVAYLLKSGADLDLVNEHLRTEMSAQQIKLLEELIHNSKMIELSGCKILISTAGLPNFLDGLAGITRKLLEVESADAAFTAVEMKDRCHIVGRSDTPMIDVAAVVQNFGGNGHHGAGSAVVKGKSPETLKQEIEQFLARNIKPETTAKQIMSSPVPMIRPVTTMEEAGRILLRYKQDGLVVAENDTMVGVVSKRDIEQALHHKLGHAPVQGFMSHPVISVTPQTPLSEIQQMMVRHDIGRLPVLDEKHKVVGLVSRAEVIRQLYGLLEGQDNSASDITDFPHTDVHISVCDRLDQLPETAKWLVAEIGIAAAELRMLAYLVGGPVRDLMLGIPNLDLDFVVEGSAIELASHLHQKYADKISIAAEHERFKTARLMFNDAGDGGQNIRVDLSTARTEVYEYPAALPAVAAAGLSQDLYRRDFTINALAVCVNPDKYGELIDYFAGLQDLENKTIRILHPFSFIEDPTRIVRAARFAARLGFKLDHATRSKAETALSMGIFDNLGGVRIRSEIKLILESPARLKALDLLGSFSGTLCYLDAHLKYGPAVRKNLRRAERILERFPVAEPWVVYLAVLIESLDRNRVDDLLGRLHPDNDTRDRIKEGLALSDRLSCLKANAKPSQIYHVVHDVPEHSLIIAASLGQPGSFARRAIRMYMEKFKDVQTSLTGADLLKMGLHKGPLVGQALSMLRDGRLDGTLKNTEDEIAFIKSNFAVATANGD